MALEQVTQKLNLDATQFQSVLDKILAKARELSTTIASKFKIDSSGTDKLSDGLNKASNSANGLQSKLGDVTKGIAMGFGISIFDKFTSSISDAVSEMGKLGVEYDKSLKELSAITGIVDAEPLAKLGQAARDLNLQFGTGITENVESFKAVLSRFGPDIGNSPTALKEMGVAINTLALAGGVSAKDSMDAITQTMMQFGVATGSASEISAKATSVMNTLAAGAQVGAAEVDQVAKAMVKTGANAKNANVSIEETNAAIQVIASKGGVFGENAGEKLSAIFRALVNASGPASKALKSVGIDSTDLAKTLTTKGLAAALEEVANKTNDLSAASKSQVFGTVFGADAVAVGSALVSNVATLKDYTKAVTDTSIGFEQAAIIQGSFANQSQLLKAKIQDALLGTFQKLAPILATAFSALTPLIDFLVRNLDIIGPIVGGLAAAVTILGVASLASSFGVGALSAAWGTFTAFLLANPITAVIAGLVALGAIVYTIGEGIANASTRTVESQKAQTQSLIDANAKQQEIVKNQIKQNENNLASIATFDQMIAKYDELNNKKQRTADEDKQLQKVTKDLESAQRDLNKEYPKSIYLTKTWQENAAQLKTDLKLEDVDYTKLTSEVKSAISTYEALGNKANKTKEEQDKLAKANDILSKTYPGVIKTGVDFATNLDGIKRASGLTNDSIGDLQKRLTGLGEAQAKLTKQIIADEMAIAKNAAFVQTEGKLFGDNIFGNVSKQGIEQYKQALSELSNATNRIDVTKAEEKISNLIASFKFQPGDLAKVQKTVDTFRDQRLAALVAYGYIKDDQKEIVKGAEEINKQGERDINLKDESAKKSKTKKEILDDEFKLAKETFDTNKENFKIDENSFINAKEKSILDQKRSKNSIDELENAKKKLDVDTKTKENFLETFKQFASIGPDGTTLVFTAKADKDIQKTLTKEFSSIVNDLEKSGNTVIKSKIQVDTDIAKFKTDLTKLNSTDFEYQVQIGLADQRVWTAKLEKELEVEQTKLTDLQVKLKLTVPESAEWLSINQEIGKQTKDVTDKQKDVRESAAKEWLSIERQYIKDNETLGLDTLEFQRGLLNTKRDFDLKINKDDSTKQREIWSKYWTDLSGFQDKYKSKSVSLVDSLINQLKGLDFTSLSNALTNGINKSIDGLKELGPIKDSIKSANKDLTDAEVEYLNKRKELESDLNKLYDAGGDTSADALAKKQQEITDLDKTFEEKTNSIKGTIDGLNTKLTDLSPWNIFKDGVASVFEDLTKQIKTSLDKTTAEILASYGDRTKQTAIFKSREEEINKMAIQNVEGYEIERAKLKKDRLLADAEFEAQVDSNLKTLLAANLAAASTTLAEFAISGKQNIGELGLKFLDLADQMTIAIGMLYIQKALMSSPDPITATAIAIAAMLAAKIAIAGFKAAIVGGFATGGEVSNGILRHPSGLVPTSTRVIEINETGEPEYIVNAKSTKKHKGLLDLINQGKDPSNYFKNQIDKTNIYNTNLDLTEMVKQQTITNDRLMKIENAQLNSYNRSTVKIEQGPLKLSGSDLVSVVDKINRKRMV